MLSKKMRQVLLSFLFFPLLFLVSCSYFFEQKEEETEATYNAKVGTCISTAHSEIATYFRSDSALNRSSSSLGDAFHCYNEAIDSFLKHTVSGGANPNEYESEKLYKFLREFYPDLSMSQERVSSYIQIKAFLIGGGQATVSKKELRIIQEIIPRVSKVFQDLSSYRKVLLRQQSLGRIQKDYDFFNESFLVLKSGVQDILKEVDQHKGNRSIDIREAMRFLLQEYFGETRVGDYDGMLDLLISFKNFVAVSTDNKLHRDQFSYLLNQVVIAYEAFLKAELFLLESGKDKIFSNLGHVASFVTRIPYMLNDSSLFKTVALDSLVDVVRGFETVMRSAVLKRKNKKVPFLQVEGLLFGFQSAGLMNLGMTKALSTFLELFGLKWLDPYNQGESALNNSKLDYIHSLLFQWIERQQLVNTLFSRTQQDSVSLYKRDLELKNAVLDRWSQVLTQVRTHQWDSKSRVLYTADLSEMSYEELTASNSLISIGELFMKPYNADVKDPLKHVMTEDQAQEIYSVLRPIGVEMAFMDSRIFDSGNRAFTESNNFTTQNKADSFIDYYEGYEYLSVAMASGKLADRIYADLPDACHLDYNDVHFQNVTEKECYDRFIKKNFLNYFDHLPLMSVFWESSSLVERNSFYESLEISSRAGVLTDKPVDLGEIRVLVSVLYYLQGIFDRFDEDRNGVATGEELIKAEKHFRPMIRDFLMASQKDMILSQRWIFRQTVCSHVKEEKSENFFETQEFQGIVDCLAPRLYVHLLETGELPIGISSNSLRFLTKNSPILGRRKDQTDWVLERLHEIQATPQVVVRVFSALAKVSHQGAIKRVFNFIIKRREELKISLADSEVPQCLRRNALNPHYQVDHPFCQFSRMLFCNENVNEDLHQYLRRQRTSLFLDGDWDIRPQYNAAATMEKMYSFFEHDHFYSMHCQFPHLKEGYADSFENKDEKEPDDNGLRGSHSRAKGRKKSLDAPPLFFDW